MVIKKIALIAIVTSALFSFTAKAKSHRIPILARRDITADKAPDKYFDITVEGPIQLHRRDGDRWQGSTLVTITNNWPVVVTATIVEHQPSIVSDPVNHPFLCWFEPDAAGLDNNHSTIQLHPYPDGYTFRLWSAIDQPNIAARASSSAPQPIATVYVTLHN